MTDLDQYVRWLKDLQVLAVIAHKFNKAKDDLARDIWRRAACLQLRTVNYDAGELAHPRDLPKEFPTCRKNVMTRDQLIETIKKMFE